MPTLNTPTKVAGTNHGRNVGQYYMLRAIVGGVEGPCSNVVFIGEDTTPPVLDTINRVTWSSVPGATAYRLYRFPRVALGATSP